MKIASLSSYQPCIYKAKDLPIHRIRIVAVLGFFGSFAVGALCAFLYWATGEEWLQAAAMNLVLAMIPFVCVIIGASLRLADADAEIQVAWEEGQENLEEKESETSPSNPEPEDEEIYETVVQPRWETVPVPLSNRGLNVPAPRATTGNSVSPIFTNN